MRTAGGNVKLVNLASNIGALVTSLMSGKVFLVLGLIGTVTSFLGHFLGAGLAIKTARRSSNPRSFWSSSCWPPRSFRA